MESMKILVITGLLAVQLLEIHGHGMMMDPVSRSSAWRKGFPVEKNYDDMSLFCGGFAVQFEQNGGRCGLCGDNYALPQPRPNENGGIYGTGVIVRKYNRGQTINANIKLTANHKGTFTFHLCPLQYSNQLESEGCFNGHLLRLGDGSTAHKVPQGQSEFNIAVRLPAGLTCQRCVLRWTYRAGNNWGDCGNGTSGQGCGNQETFKNCADITIS